MSRSLLASLFDEIERRPLSVSELTSQVRGALENRFASVWVEGEISNFKAANSGHWYFTIKDEGAQLRATCFRGLNRAIRFRPSDGLQVRVRGRLSVYEPRGDYELCVEALDPVGAGALRVAFEQMRERLAAEGLFDEDRKRPLPLLPRRVGVVTSPTGAATPSAAAELVAAREDEIGAYVFDLTRDLLRATHFQIMEARSRVQEAA